MGGTGPRAQSNTLDSRMVSGADARPNKRVEKYKFTWQNAIANDPDLPLATKGVAYTLSLYARADGGNVHPGNDRLARQCCVTDRQLRRHIGVLERRGYLFRVCRGTNLGRTIRANQWNLVVPEDPAVSESYRTSMTEPPEVDDRASGHQLPPNSPSEHSSSNLAHHGMRPGSSSRAHHGPHDDHSDDDSLLYAMALDDLHDEFPYASALIDDMGECHCDIPQIKGVILKQYGREQPDDEDDGFASSLVYVPDYDQPRTDLPDDDPWASPPAPRRSSDNLADIMDRLFDNPGERRAR